MVLNYPPITDWTNKQVKRVCDIETFAIWVICEISQLKYCYKQQIYVAMIRVSDMHGRYCEESMEEVYEFIVEKLKELSI